MDMPKFIHTKDTLTRRGIVKLFGFTPIGDSVAVCDGEWRRQKNLVWRFWRNADL